MKIMEEKMTESLNRTASWVIQEKETGVVIMETFDPKKVDALNTIKYEAIPIGDYLISLNAKIKLLDNTPSTLGHLGGLSKSPIKVQASKENGKKGGRVSVGSKLKLT